MRTNALLIATLVAPIAEAQDAGLRKSLRARIVRASQAPITLDLQIKPGVPKVRVRLRPDARVVRRVSVSFDEVPRGRNCFLYGRVDEPQGRLALTSVKCVPGLDRAKPGIQQRGEQHRVVGRLVLENGRLAAIVGEKRLIVRFEMIPSVQIEESGTTNDLRPGRLVYVHGTKQGDAFVADLVTVLVPGKGEGEELGELVMAGLTTPDTLPVIDDCDRLSTRWSWRKSPVRIELAETLSHSGIGAVRVSFIGGPREDALWLMVDRSFTPKLDVRAYTHLECRMRLEGPSPGYGDALLGHRAVPSDKSAGTHVFDLPPGQWTRVLFSLRRLTDRRRLAGWRFMVRPDKYPDGREVSLLIDDIRAVRIPPTRDLGRLKEFPWSRQPDAAPPEQVTLYPVMLFETVYPSSRMHDRPALDKLELTACRGERAPVTFALWSPTSIRDRRVSVTNLTRREGGSIPGETVDCRVVKVWEQSSPGQVRVLPGVSPARAIPELLVYDDAAPFADGFAEEGGKRVSYRPPPPIQPPLRTDIAAGTVKQFWLNVSVPANAADGLYRGTIEITGKGVSTVHLPFEVHVLPWVLPPAAKLYGIYAWYVSSDPTHPLYRSRSQHVAELRMMKEAGVEAIACWMQRDRDVTLVLERMKEVGMKGPFVTLGFIGSTVEEKQKALAVAEGLDIPLYFYGMDEPNNPGRVKGHLQRARDNAAAGGRTMAAITVPYVRRLAVANSRPYQIAPGPVVPLEWANLALDPTYRHFLRTHAPAETPRVAPVQTVYWQCNVEVPTMNRFCAGFHVWAAGMDGAFPNVFQSYPLVSPYNSGDRREAVGRGGRVVVARHSCTVYPTQGDAIPTLQWESLRAGINDARYLTLLADRIAYAKASGRAGMAAKAERELNQLLRPFRVPPSGDPDAVLPQLNGKELLYVEPMLMISARQRVVSLLRSLGAQ